MSTQDVVVTRDEIAERLRKAREAKGLSQYRLGKMSGVLIRSINYWEKGQGEPSISAAMKLAKAMKMGLDELFGEGKSKAERRSAG